MMDALEPLSPPPLLYPSANYISSIAKEIKERHVHRAKKQGSHKEIKKNNTIPTRYAEEAKEKMKMEDDTTPTWPPLEDCLPLSRQNELLDLYYIHVHPLYPAIHRNYMQKQLEKCNDNNDSSSALWPFVFYTVFSIATQYSDSSCHHQADYCLHQALSWHHIHKIQPPSIMTVLALTLLAKCLELSKKQHRHVARTWKIADEIFRVIQHLGLYSTTTSIDDLYDDESEKERAVRIFWIAHTYDHFLGITTGRPPAIDERKINIPLPKSLQTDDENDGLQLEHFLSLIEISKGAGRIMQLSPGPAGLCAHSIHAEAILSTCDAWICEELRRLQTSTAHRLHITERRLILYDLLILLHKPFLEDGEAKEDWNRKCLKTLPHSHRICTDTAIVISDTICELSLSDLEYVCKKPECFHALLTATRIHLLNTSIPDNAAEMIQGKIHFAHSMAAYEALAPTSSQAAGIYSLWHRSMKQSF